MVREDILQQFPELFGTKVVNGREINVEETIATLTRELRPEIATVLAARRALFECARGRPKIRLAALGRDVYRPRKRDRLDVSPDCPGADRQTFWARRPSGAGASTTRFPSPRTSILCCIPGWSSPGRGIRWTWRSMP